MKRIQPTWYMRKDMLYFEIEYFKSWQTIGCKHLSTLTQWVYYIEKAILLFKDRSSSLYKYFYFLNKINSKLIQKNKNTFNKTTRSNDLIWKKYL